MPMLTSLLLAAGESRRMGRPKALLTLPSGETFLDEASHAVRACAIPLAIAIVGTALAETLAARDHGFAAIIVNESPQKGQLLSVQLGLSHLILNAPSASGTLLHLVDNPGQLQDRMGMVMAEVERTGGGSLIAAAFQREPGHPLWLPRRLWEGVLAWAGPDGLRGFIASTGETVCLLETGLESTHWDIDTPEAYRQLVNPAPD